MFDRLLNPRLRAAEQALKAGRIDDAHRMASATDLRFDRKAQSILKDVAERLVERAQQHFGADRFAEALRDLGKAEEALAFPGSGHQPASGADQTDGKGAAGAPGAGGQHATPAIQRELERVAQLRENIRIVASAMQKQAKERRNRLEQARDRVKAGSLVAGHGLLAEVSVTDGAALEFRREVEQRMADARRAFEKCAALLAEGALNEAITQLRKGLSIQRDVPEAGDLERRVVEAVVSKVRQLLDDGSPGRARDQLAALGELGRRNDERMELAEAMAAIESASTKFAGGAYNESRHELNRAKRWLTGAKWIDGTIEQLRQADELLGALRVGPLGGMPARDAQDAGRRRSPTALADTIAVGPGTEAKKAAPLNAERLLVLIDDGGSYLLLRQSRVTIGRASTSNPPDIPLYSDLADRHAEIQRIDGDYFMFGVEGQRLLADGERVRLGRRGKFTFRRPSRRSSSAVLDLADSSKLANDVRRVVLFQDNAVIGRGPYVHMNCTAAERDIVLFDRGGRLYIRPQERGRAAEDGKLVALGEPIEIAGMRMVVKRLGS